MGDAENNLQPSKKRAAGVQLSRDNPGLDENEETSEQEAGTFKRASEEVLATRRIVKVRRQASSAPSAPASDPASNPFAAIRLIPSVSSSAQVEVEAPTGKNKESEQSDEIKSEKKVDEPEGESTAEEAKTDDANDDNIKKSESTVEDNSVAKLSAQKNETENDGAAKSLVEATNATEVDNTDSNVTEDVKDEENEEKKGNGEANAQKNAETASFSSFQQLSSGQNAFSGITGTGFSSTSFSFGSLTKDGSSNSLFGLKNDNPTFGFGVSNNENSSIFGTSAANIISKSSEGSKIPPMQEVPVETGEENETAVFTADSALFEFTDGAWKERGKGELKVNISTNGTGKPRLVMRARGNYRLILNASLFPDMKLTNMEKKGITFACVNSASEGKVGLSTIALKFKDASFVEDFRAAVMEHKDKSGVALKTPENSPKASDE